MNDFLDELWYGIKKVTKVAGQKTTELASLGKLKYQEQTLKRDITKAYAKLGALVYESRVNNEDVEQSVTETIDEITNRSADLDNLTAEIELAKEELKKEVEFERPEVNEEDDFAVDIDFQDTDDAMEDIITQVDEIADDLISDQKNDNEF